MNRALSQVASKILDSQKITIVLHRNPDGDAIGSAMALFEALSDKDTEIASNSPVDKIFEKIIALPKLQTTLRRGRDCYIVLDCSESHRTNFPQQIRRVAAADLVVLDHHATRGDLARTAEHCLTSPAYSATAEIVDDLLKEMRQAVTPPISTALLLGIFTDTNGFKNPNTSEHTLARASKLIRQGGNLHRINKAFLQRLTATKRKLWGALLAKLELGRLGIAIIRVTQKEIKAAGAEIEDVFGLANVVALTSGARASLVLIEQKSGWRGILRTRHHRVDVGRLARLLGGKGQPKAAGFVATNEVFSGRIDR